MLKAVFSDADVVRTGNSRDDNRTIVFSMMILSGSLLMIVKKKMSKGQKTGLRRFSLVLFTCNAL